MEEEALHQGKHGVRPQAVGRELCMLEMPCEGPKMMMMIMMTMAMTMTTMMMNHVRAISFGVKP